MRASNRIYQALSMGFDGRVWPNKRPSGHSGDARVYAVYQRISGVPENTIDGYTEINHCRYQITVYSDVYDDVVTFGEKSKRLIDNDKILNAQIMADEVDQDPETDRWFMRFDVMVWEQLNIGV